MTMKTKIYQWVIAGMLAGSVAGLVSCESWLDVEPKSEIKSDNLFETESGFKDALIGAYMLMTDQNSYGLEMNIGFVDVLAQQYELGQNTNVYYNASLYEYTVGNVSSRIDKIWEKSYNTIANLNNILMHIDEKKPAMHPANYSIIKGEALGLRAFLHFDLLRLFAYGDLEHRPEMLDKLSIPWLAKYNKEIPAQSTIREVLGYIHRDLTEAAGLMTYYDPFGVTEKDEAYDIPNDDKFYTNRRKRFNYFAVKATEARVYLWEGDYPNALKCAREVINEGSTKFPWVSESVILNPEAKNKDLTFTPEHIFGLEVYNLAEIVNRYIQEGYNVTMSNYNLLYHTKVRADEIYELGDLTGYSDYRYMTWYEKGDKYTLLKFSQVDDYAYPNNIPLIKKPEMYYIAAECLNRTGVQADREEAIGLLNTVRSRRGIERMLEKNLDAAAVNQEIMKEYRKEMMSEGQLFYYYKRLGMTSIPGTSQAMDDKVYVLPFPDVEIEYGGHAQE